VTRKRNGKPPKNGHRRRNSAGKSAVPGTPFLRGVDPRRGHGPQKGAPNAGRPPEAFRQALNEMLNSEAVLTQVRYFLSGARDVTHDQFWKVVMWLSDRVYGRPVQELQHSGPSGGPIPIELQGYSDDALQRLEAIHEAEQRRLQGRR
jgi:hypothetical protein